MSITPEQMRASIVPKSDQLNAEDIMASGPRVVTIAGVSAGDREQPLNIRLEGEKRFFRPCKIMRRLLIILWGENGHDWVGQQLRLVYDPNVKFGGVVVGGIRISHLTGITEAQFVPLTVTRGIKAPYKIEPLLEAPAPAPQQSQEAQWVAPCIEAFAKEGVTENQLVERAGRPRDKWSKDDGLAFRNLLDDIQAKATTISKEFHAPPSTPSFTFPDTETGGEAPKPPAEQPKGVVADVPPSPPPSSAASPASSVPAADDSGAGASSMHAAPAHAPASESPPPAQEPGPIPNGLWRAPTLPRATDSEKVTAWANEVGRHCVTLAQAEDWEGLRLVWASAEKPARSLHAKAKDPVALGALDSMISYVEGCLKAATQPDLIPGA